MPAFLVLSLCVTASTSSSTEQLPLSYVEPHWSGTPDDDFSLLIVKNGAEIGNLRLNDKPYHTFGRLPNCDVTLEHPSISRYHAVLQYWPAGVFICMPVQLSTSQIMGKGHGGALGTCTFICEVLHGTAPCELLAGGFPRCCTPST